MNQSKKQFAIKLLITWGLVCMFIISFIFDINLIFNDDPSTALNFIILITEVFLAIGITVTVYLYSSEENKILKQLVEDQKEMLETMKPIIEKQGKIIEEQGKAERFRKYEILDGIESNLELAKGSLKYINQMQKDGFTSSSIVKEEFDNLARFSKAINDYIFSNYWWTGPVVLEIDAAHSAINNYALSQNFYHPKLNSIEKIVEKIDEIIPKVTTRKEKVMLQN